MLAFLLGAFLGFGVGVAVFWVVGCVLRLASAVFPGLEWMLPAGGLVAGEHAKAAQHARLRPRQEVAPALRRLGEALGAANHLAAAVLVHADGDHDRHVLVGAAPASLQVDAVDVDVRVFVGQGPAPPLLDRLESLVVEV